MARRPSPKAAARAAADLCRRLRNPPWPESIPLYALEAMEEVARLIEAGLQPAPAPPLWYVARYGDSSFGLEVAFFDSPLEYGRACRAAEQEHKAGDCDSYTMGTAEGPAARAAAIEAARAKTAKGGN